jgi:hypothetical protein
MDLLDRKAVCRLLGGSRPINPSTLYRNIPRLFPPPIKVGARCGDDRDRIATGQREC